MKKQFNRTALFLMLLIFGSATLLAQENDTELKQKFQKMNDDFEEAMMNDNYEAILAQYADDVISLPSYQKMVKGKSELKKQMEMDENDNYKMTDFNLTTTEVFSSGDYAYEIGRYELSMKMAEGDESWNDNGKYLTVWEKQSNGDWLVKAETWNTNNNPWQQMEEQQQMEQNKDVEKMDKKKDKMHKDKDYDKMHKNGDYDKKHKDKMEKETMEEESKVDRN